MPTFIKIISLFGLLFLFSCGGTRTVPIVTQEKRVELQIQQTKPVKLNVVQFKVIDIDGKLFVVMNLDNYEKLSKNMELLQGQIVEDKKVIENMKKYYNKN